MRIATRVIGAYDWVVDRGLDGLFWIAVFVVVRDAWHWHRRQR